MIIQNYAIAKLYRVMYYSLVHCLTRDNPGFSAERPEFVPKVGGRCMKLSPDGLSMAVGDRHGNIRIFDLEGFRQTAFLEAHDCEVLSVDYSRSSHDATFLASSSRDRFIHVFDVKKDYQLVATLDDHSAAITAVRFTFSSVTSNLQLISCGADKSLIFRSITKVRSMGWILPSAEFGLEWKWKIPIHPIE